MLAGSIENLDIKIEIVESGNILTSRYMGARMTFTWDPGHYLSFAGERGRPFVELVQRVGAT